MKKYLLLLIIIACAMLSCKEEPITIDNLISEIEVAPESIYADTETKIKVTAILNSNLDKRNVIFKTSKGIFSKNSENKVIVEAAFLDSVLSASVWIEPLSNPTELIISTQIELTDLEDVYIKSKTINILKSEPTNITLSANTFSVENDFGGEVEITGSLYNNEGNGVSQGYEVIINDYDSTFKELQGHFRNSNLTSNSKSEISTIYTPGVIEPNQFVYLIATVLNTNQGETNISDTIRVYINQKE